MKTKIIVPEKLIEKVINGELSASRAAQFASVSRDTITRHVRAVKPDWMPIVSHTPYSIVRKRAERPVAQRPTAKDPEFTCEWCGAAVEKGTNYCSVRCATRAGRYAKGLPIDEEPTYNPPTRDGEYYRVVDGKTVCIYVRGTCGGSRSRY